MGKNNKARRAAKAKDRQRGQARTAHRRASEHSFRAGAEHGFVFSDSEAATHLWLVAAGDRRRGGSPDKAVWARLTALPRRLSLRAAETLVLEHVDVLYANGWQPAELLRQGRLNGLSASCGRMVARAIACDDARRRATTLDAAWIAQVASLNLPGDNGSSGWLDRWSAGEGPNDLDVMTAVLETFAALLRLPALQPLLPSPGPPGGRPRQMGPGARRGGVADPVLTRVRNLLAKAESSTFEAEATAFTAKAQELITRHAIDVALLEEGSSDRAAPVETRVAIDPPYADAKSLLVQTVAETGSCRAVSMPHVQMSTLLGFPADVDAVELLFTSLLVQAQRAMNQAAKAAPPGARTRTQSYRSAFLLAYAQRIGDRLRQTRAETVDEATRETGKDMLPVLADRSSVVAALMSERFGDLQQGAVRGGYDSAGWAGGYMAAESAQLSFAELSHGPETGRG